METQPATELFRSQLPVRTRKDGTCYLKVGKEFAQLTGIARAAFVDVSIWRLVEKPKEEKKK